MEKYKKKYGFYNFDDFIKFVTKVLAGFFVLNTIIFIWFFYSYPEIIAKILETNFVLLLASKLLEK